MCTIGTTGTMVPYGTMVRTIWYHNGTPVPWYLGTYHGTIGTMVNVYTCTIWYHWYTCMYVYVVHVYHIPAMVWYVHVCVLEYHGTRVHVFN